MIKFVEKEDPLMQIVSILTVIFAVLLLGTVVWGLRAQTEKYVTYGLVASRLLLLALIALTLYLTLANLHGELALGIINLVWQFITLVLLESAFRRKRQTFGSPRLSSLLIVAVLITIILAVV